MTNEELDALLRELEGTDTNPWPGSIWLRAAAALRELMEDRARLEHLKRNVVLGEGGEHFVLHFNYWHDEDLYEALDAARATDPAKEPSE